MNLGQKPSQNKPSSMGSGIETAQHEPQPNFAENGRMGVYIALSESPRPMSSGELIATGRFKGQDVHNALISLRRDNVVKRVKNGEFFYSLKNNCNH